MTRAGGAETSSLPSAAHAPGGNILILSLRAREALRVRLEGSARHRAAGRRYPHARRSLSSVRRARGVSKGALLPRRARCDSTSAARELSPTSRLEITVRWSRSAPNCEKMSLRSGRDVLMEVSRADD